ncbi:phospholipid carrier-dependent glycosyltransferase [Candidatus Woesebacteria bacterium]|nr:phospholipid carrier-dependent glycosyltransferase [Candidatus Woesebacteria bacterium]
MISTRQKQSVIFVCILAFAFFSRVYRIHIPERYMFDEVYHAVTAKLIARNDLRAFEWWNPPPEANTAVDWLHPPLAKYAQAVSILMFGENTFGWRFSSVIFGVISIALLYLLIQKLTGSINIALLAAFLASLDGLLLVQSRIAMNDIHVTAAILGTLLMYTHYRKQKKPWQLFCTGILAGVSMGTKWSGVFSLGIIWTYELLEYLRSELVSKAFFWNRLKRLFFVFWTRTILLVLLPVCVYIASYGFMFYQGKDLIHLRDMHKQIWWYQTNLKATHPFESRPYQWFLDLRPVWMSVDYNDSRVENIYAFGNPALFWLGDIAVVSTLLIWMHTIFTGIFAFFKKKHAAVRKSIASTIAAFLKSPLFFMVFSYAAVWMPWQFSPRIMFFYHYTPAVPFLASILAYWLIKIWNISQLHTAAVVISVASIVLCFIMWYPHWTGLPVPVEFANAVYFALPGWK